MVNDSSLIMVFSNVKSDQSKEVQKILAFFEKTVA